MSEPPPQGPPGYDPACYDSRPDTYEHIGEVRKLLGVAIRELLWRADHHDESKLTEPELSTFNEFTPKLKDLVYGSDEYKAALAGMGPALEHHYCWNTHHPEHHPDGVSGMTLLDLIEMLSDWKAASLRVRPPAPAAPGRPDAPEYDNDFIRSIKLNQERFGFTDELRAILENTAAELGFV